MLFADMAETAAAAWAAAREVRRAPVSLCVSVFVVVIDRANR